MTNGGTLRFEREDGERVTSHLILFSSPCKWLRPVTDRQGSLLLIPRPSLKFSWPRCAAVEQRILNDRQSVLLFVLIVTANVERSYLKRELDVSYDALRLHLTNPLRWVLLGVLLSFRG
jgi:hypothetical protein